MKHRYKSKKVFKIAIYLVNIFIFILIFAFFIYYYGKVYPGVFVLNKQVSGRNQKQTESFLEQEFRLPNEISLVSVSGQVYKIPIDKIEAKINYSKMAEEVYKMGRSGNILEDFKTVISLPVSPYSFNLEVGYSKEKLNEYLSAITDQNSVEPINPSLTIANGKVVVNAGKKGEYLNTEELATQIEQKLKVLDNQAINLAITIVDPSLNEAEINYAQKRAEKLLDSEMDIKFEDLVFVIADKDLITFMNPYGGYNSNAIEKTIEKIKKEVEREPQNPTFVFKDGRVQEFAAAKNGIKLLSDNLVNEILNAMTKIEAGESQIAIQAPVSETKSEFTTGDVNNLGIVELIGKGTSNFRGSISSRVYNISLAASKLKGVLIKPGEVFSFNQALGDVSKYTGYKEAYIIQDGKTILGDGGGVCQVSTTLFRAVLSAGLPITERRAHTYRVGYYEQGFPPGLDATVYTPTTDFKFKNNTSNHILIQSATDPKNNKLTFELYGTGDGRVAETTKPVVYDSVAPPEDLYVDDPTLPNGQIKQIEYKAWGAKVKFNYKVQRNGEVIYEKTFLSNYRPWGAVFLRGVGP